MMSFTTALDTPVQEFENTQMLFAAVRRLGEAKLALRQATGYGSAKPKENPRRVEETLRLYNVRIDELNAEIQRRDKERPPELALSERRPRYFGKRAFRQQA